MWGLANGNGGSLLKEFQGSPVLEILGKIVVFDEEDFFKREVCVHACVWACVCVYAVREFPHKQVKCDSKTCRPEMEGGFLQVCREAAGAAVGCRPLGTLQMVNRPVTIDTINDYMHKRNGQKSRSDLGGLSLGVLKPATTGTMRPCLIFHN